MFDLSVCIYLDTTNGSDFYFKLYLRKQLSRIRGNDVWLYNI